MIPPHTLLLVLCVAFSTANTAPNSASESAVSLGQFMEEVRGAMSSQWELLQNLRYHTLGIKLRLAQLEGQLQALATRLPPLGKADGGAEGKEGGVKAEQDGQTEAEDENGEREGGNQDGGPVDEDEYGEGEAGDQNGEHINNTSVRESRNNDSKITDDGEKGSRENIDNKGDCAGRDKDGDVSEADEDDQLGNVHNSGGRGFKYGWNGDGTNGGGYGGDRDVIAALVKAVQNLTAMHASLVESRVQRGDGEPGQEKEGTEVTETTTLPTTPTTNATDVTTTAGDEIQTEEAAVEKTGPRILQHLSPNVTATEGDTAELTCWVKDLQEYSVAWVRHEDATFLALDGYLLTRNPRLHATLEPHTGLYTLTVQEVMLNDAGPYECQIATEPIVAHTVWLTVTREGEGETERDGEMREGEMERDGEMREEEMERNGEMREGEMERDGEMRERELERPRIEGSEGNVTAQAGNTATLKCRIHNHHDDKVLWYRGEELLARGFEIVTPDNRFASTRTGAFTWWLDIANLRTADTGAYRCQLPSSPLVKHTFYITVLGDPEVASTVNEGTTVTTVKGGTATLSCKVLNVDTETVSWMRLRDLVILALGQFMFTADHRITVSRSRSGHDWDLKIAGVTDDDAGEYECQASTNPPITRTFTLNVVDPPPVLLDTPLSVTAPPGTTAVLACHVRNLGTHRVAWMREKDLVILGIGEHSIIPDPRISVEGGGEEWRLVMREVREEDEGGYQCMLNTSPANIKTFMLRVQDASPPEVEINPANATTVVGHDVTLTCDPSGDPQPFVTWRRRDLTFDPSRHSVDSYGDLVIRDVMESDSGWYDCSASNQHGMAEGSAKLTVLRPTRIVRPPRDKERMEGQTAVFRCKATADPSLSLTVTWLKDGHQIEFMDSIRLGLRHNNALVVSEARREDAGVYTCLATTPLDTATANATLTIEGTKDERGGDVIAPPTLDYCPPPFERLRVRLCVLQVTDRKLDWQDAHEHCRREGGSLAWAGGEEDVFQIFLHERYGLGGDTWTHWPFWVGGRLEDDGVWRWVDGTQVAPRVWARGHPRDYTTQSAPDGICVVLDGYQDYQATSLPCHYRRFFLCRV